MSFIFRHLRPSKSKNFVPSFVRIQKFDGSRTCADPSGIMRGSLLDVWIRPLRLSITTGTVKYPRTTKWLSGAAKIFFLDTENKEKDKKHETSKN